MTESTVANVAHVPSRPLSSTIGPSAAEAASRSRAGRRVFVIGVFVVVALAGALAAGTVALAEPAVEAVEDSAVVPDVPLSVFIGRSIFAFAG